MNLDLMDGTYSICKLPAERKIPSSVYESHFFSISKTQDEVSVVCESKYGPSGVQVEKDWSIIRVVGPLSFELTGVLSSLSMPLADADISIFVISTFDTDYLMVRKKDLRQTMIVLESEGFKFF